MLLKEKRKEKELNWVAAQPGVDHRSKKLSHHHHQNQITAALESPSPSSCDFMNPLTLA